jgi:hypothetical protein
MGRRRGGGTMIQHDATSILNAWQNFYVIVGSSAGALTGLQFVVIALIAEARSAGSMLEIRAFGTPTVVHFCASLLISAILTAPWPSISGPAFALGICGLAGVLYDFLILRHARRQTGYTPDAEDWLWYFALPLASHAILITTAVFLTSHVTRALFVIAAVTLVLLFIGIHNSWDTVTYIAVKHLRRSDEMDKP